MTVSDDHELHTLAGPYAMDAVTLEERVSFAAHLGDCAQCRDDVREMREATARLGMAAMVRPRPELKEQTMRAAFRTSQLAPVVESTTVAASTGVAAAPSRDERVPRRRRLAGRGRSFPMSARFALASAAVAVVAATGFGLMANNMLDQLHNSQRQDHMIAAVLNASDAVILTVRVTTGGTATVVMSHHEHRLVFTAHGLRALRGGMGYELWLMGPAGDRPMEMLRPQSDGMAGPAVVSGLKQGDAVGVTVEPAGGSSLPTSTVIVMIRQRG